MLPMTPFQDQSFNRSFSQLAKESSFTFNLYRGRVDWRKLEAADVDRIVRDQDVEMLNIHLSSITNCNLESEYDVKILDPNFVKLFKLAQLLIDFLLHCKKYLEHCIKVAHDIIQSSNKEVEGLRNQLHTRKTEVKQLKGKIKEIKLQLQYSQTLPVSNFKCSLCGKVFVSDEFLDAHLSRRHRDHHWPDSRVLKPVNRQNACKQCEKRDPPQNADDGQENIKKKYQEEIEEMKRLFFVEVQKLKHPDVKKCSSKSGDAQDDFRGIPTSEADKENRHQHQQSADANGAPQAQPKAIEAKVIAAQPSTGLPSNLTKDEKVEMENDVDKREEQWLERLEQREGIWRTRLADLDQQYQRQVSSLQDRLAAAHNDSQEVKTQLERRLEEVMGKFEQCQAIASKRQVEEGPSGDEAPTTRSQSALRITNDHPTRLSSTVESGVKLPKQPPPFQKRKAFVSQKTKTIQDASVDTPNEKENVNNLVRILAPGEDSDLEVIPLESQRTSLKSDSENLPITDPPSRTADKNKRADDSVRSKPQDGFSVRKGLDENPSKGSSRMLMFDSEDDREEEESSVTETYTESESEISEEDGQRLTGGKETEAQLRHDPADLKWTEKQLVGRGPSDSQLIRTEAELAQQSLQSMEKVLVDNPGILGQLRADLERLVGRRMHGLGVDPTWSHIPPATFENKMAVLRHQRQITAKNHAVFYTLRDRLDAEANAAVRDRPATVATAQSLVARLRNRVAKVTRRLGSFKNRAEKSPAQPSLTPAPLSSSSPRDPGQKFILPAASSAASSRPQESPDSLSPTLSESEDGLEKEEEESVPVKSALRNALSTGNLAKKRVLFVDQPITEEKRSLSESTVAAASSDASVSSLADRIEHLLSSRGGRPAAGVDLMRSTPASFPLELPLSELLPLSKSGRELLESEAIPRNQPLGNSSDSSAPSRMPSPRTLEPLGHIVKKVPVSQPRAAASGAPQTSANKSSSASFPQREKASPSLSLSSVASSLLYNVAIDSPKTADESLALDLQDLEDNLRF